MQVVLVYFKDDGEQKNIHLPAKQVVVGREKGCDLRIPLPSVSRKHCQLRQEGDALYVKDLGSSNGTYRNGQKLEGEEQVEAGDQLAIGSVIMTVQIDGDPEYVEPPLLEAPVAAGGSSAPPSPDDTDPEDLRSDEEGDASDDSDDISDLIKRASKAVNDEDDSDIFNLDLGIDDDDKS